MESAPIVVRHEQPEDIAAIRDVNRRAFGQDAEGAIVDALRANGASVLSLVATIDEAVVGHIMFSPASIGPVAGAALGPMAVVPDQQRRGIGSRLVTAGLRHLGASGTPYVIVVGHPEYYPRFGFTPARARGITSEWEVPDEAFMVAVLDPAGMQGVSGLAKYRPEFSTT